MLYTTFERTYIRRKDRDRGYCRSVMSSFLGDWANYKTSVCRRGTNGTIAFDTGVQYVTVQAPFLAYAASLAIAYHLNGNRNDSCTLRWSLSEVT